MSDYGQFSIAKMSFHDSSIEGILWEKDGENLVFVLKWLPQSGLGMPTGPTKAFLVFTFVTDLVLDVKFAESMGYPSIYSSEFSILPKERWSVTMTFAGIPDGSILFECNDMELFVGEARSIMENKV